MSRWPKRVPIGDPADRRSFESLIAWYLEWREIRGFSPRARGSAESTLRTFGRWCEERGITRPGEVSRELAERYQRWLFHVRREDGRPLAVRTQLGRLVVIKSFFRWLTKERYLLYNPTTEIELPKEPVRLPVDSFSAEEIERILSVPDVTTALGLRDRALLEVLYSTGIRRGEVAALDIYDLDFERGWVTVRGGKGGKDRVVPIGERALAWVRKYIDETRRELVMRVDEVALFVVAEGVRMSRAGLGNKVKSLIELSGVRDRIGSCHLFRHTMATQMLENGADVRYLQEMLGHSKLTTTQIYTKVSIGKLKAVHTATHPTARLKRRAVPAEPAPEPIEELIAAEVEATQPTAPAEGVKRLRTWRPERTR